MLLSFGGRQYYPAVPGSRKKGVKRSPHSHPEWRLRPLAQDYRKHYALTLTCAPFALTEVALPFRADEAAAALAISFCAFAGEGAGNNTLGADEEIAAVDMRFYLFM